MRVGGCPDDVTVVEWIKRDLAVINLGIFFDAATAARPDGIAVIDLSEDAPQTWTYAALEGEVRRAALALRAAGLASRERLIVSIPNGLRFLTTFLGALRLGVVPVPINFRLGADALAAHLCDRLGVAWHETTADGGVTLEPVFCLGLCAVGPSALLDGKPLARLDPARADAALGSVS